MTVDQLITMLQTVKNMRGGDIPVCISAPQQLLAHDIDSVQLNTRVLSDGTEISTVIIDGRRRMFAEK